MRIDLNADLAESFGRWELGDDDALLDVVTSANVACGCHAGDPSVIARACARAAARGVATGAQVAYRDLAGFGRRFIDHEEQAAAVVAAVVRYDPALPAVLHDAEEIAARCARLATRGEIVAVDGTVVPVRAASICVHGDTPGAVGVARAVRTALTEAGATLAPFAPGADG
ncbi:MAG TPA: LamB/YcsF family protein [Streptosporangiaceae bacterium]